LAIIFAVLVQVAPLVGLPSSFALIGEQVVYLNLFLAFFNLLPLPPLDGSKILPPLLGLVSTEAMMQYQRFRMWLEQNIFLGFAIVIFLVFYVLGGPLYALVQYLGNFLLHLL